MTRISASAAPSPDRDEHAAIVWNLVLSQEEEVSPATVMTSGEVGEITVGGTSGESRRECSVLTASLKL